MPSRNVAVAALLVIVSVAGVLLAQQAELLRWSFVRLVSWQSGRSIEVRGALHLHLLSNNPRIDAERVTIGNPPWTKPGLTADIGKLTVILAPLLSHQKGLSLLNIETAQLYLIRDRAGHANWQRFDPDRHPGRPLPIIRALELAHTHLTLVDERLHLVFEGNLSAEGLAPGQPLQIAGSGTLNQRAVTFHVKGDALSMAAPDKPYAFVFDEQSSGTHLSAHGALPRPFDFGLVDAQFAASGGDLRDLYYLVGVRLPNTGNFHLQGRMLRRGGETLFDDLKLATGESDVHGRVIVHPEPKGRTLIHLYLKSELLRLADLGLRAAGRDPNPDAQPKLLSDVTLITPGIRRVDAAGKYTARRLQISRVEVTDLSAPFTITGGLIKVPEATGHLMGGTVALRLDADANQTPTRSHMELTVKGLQLGQVPHKSPSSPYEGSLLLRMRTQGVGNSLHTFGSHADGTLNAWLTGGTMRASLAELAGVDLRGVGLTITGSKRDVAVHCAAAAFAIRSGVMRATDIFIDSEPVFITGEGQVQLDSEALDLKLHGEPKRLRIMRIKAPVLVQGTLLKPKFSVDMSDSRLRVVDRGTRRDADCASLQR